MPTITPQIVIVNAQVQAAPTPSTLQQSGALVSVGGSTLSTGTYQYCGTLAAVQAILSAAGNFVELGNMAATYFAQGNAVGVYVLELGASGGVVTTQITSLGTWITANPGVFYAYLVPALWDGSSTNLETMAGNYSSSTGKTYFFVTTTGTTNLANYTSKSIVATVTSPTAGASEFQAAALFYQWLANNPSPAAPAAPMNFRFVFGVTPWSLIGNQTVIQTILSDHGNLILTGAEGGISTSLVRNGTTMDGNQMMFWYAVDWILIQAELQQAAAIINGSNTNNPLYYNQFGINALLGILDNIGVTGISVGLLLAATFSATAFKTYVAEFPSDYMAGLYKGFTCTATPQLGFTQITFNLTATEFA